MAGRGVQISNNPAAPMRRADAHRDHAQLAAATAELVQQRGRQLRARAAERMAEGDCAAIDVQLVVCDAELAPAIDGLRGERLVDLEQVDVRDAEPALRQQFADRGARGRCP